MRTPLFLSLCVFLSSIALSSTAIAEDKVKAEDLVEKPVGSGQAADLAQIKRAKLTEEQVTQQLKYMMVQGWKRIEDDLLERGSFRPMGLVLSPKGEFRPLYLDKQEELPQEFALEAIIKTLKDIAESRTQWAVGLIYVTGAKLEDGSYQKRIIVTAEHIAGWAKSWTYPYKVVDGEVKMAQAVEHDMKPVYFK